MVYIATDMTRLGSWPARKGYLVTAILVRPSELETLLVY